MNPGAPILTLGTSFMKSSLRRRALLLFAATLLTFPALATTVVMPTDAQLVEKSPVIVVAEVTKSGSVDRNGGIWAETHLALRREPDPQQREANREIARHMLSSALLLGRTLIMIGRKQHA